MSDLDYEDEYISAENDIPIPSASINVNPKKEDSSDNSLQTSVLNSKQINEDNSSSNSLLTENGNSNEIKDTKNGVENILGDGEIITEDSSKESCDLEEGELNDSNDEESDRAVCRFFQNGSCRFGQQCRFIHIGGNAYKMFDNTSISSSIANQLFGQYNSFNIPVTNSSNIKSTWEDGLLKAKKLILESKYKKEEDVEFEEKKLYLSLPEDKIERPKGISCKRKIDYYQNKGNKIFNLSYPTKLYKPYKHTNLKRPKSDSKAVTSAQTWIDPWRRSRSRTRNESKSYSSSSSYSSDWCAESCCSDRSTSLSIKESYTLSKKKLSNSQSKLGRAFDRTFSSRRRHKVSSSSDRSRSPMISRKHSLSPLSRSKRKKLFIRKFHSRSPSSSADERRKHTRKEIERPFIKKSNFCNIVQTIPPKQTKGVHLENKHTRSPYLSGRESTCSDMSISSLNCTSVSSSNNHSLKNEPSIKKEISEFGKFTSKKSEAFLKSYASDIDNKCHSKKSENVQKFTPAKISRPTFKLGCESTTEVKLEHKKSIPDINTTFNKQNKNQSKSAKKHPASAVENELLRFASACNQHKRDNQINSGLTTKSSITLPIGKKVTMSKKHEKCEVLAAPPQVKKPVTRREQLLMQLKAIEMAIAKKKSLVSPQR